MTRTVISVEGLSKRYRLGVIGRATLREDLNGWWARARGRHDLLGPIGAPDHGNRQGGEIWALRDVSFEVQEGEILGVIGRNGAGKSTLLRILSRITAPTTGRAVIRGRVGSLLEVGTGFHPELTGRENIYLNGTILGMTKAEVDRKLEEIVEFAEMAPFIDTPVKRYSSGMTVRLAFAVAAHLEPEILIVDEVLAVGDAAFQKKCLGKMERVAAGGRTILFVSHNLSAIARLCHRAIWIHRGGVELDGLCQRVVDEYESQQVGLLMRAGRQTGKIGQVNSIHDFRILGTEGRNSPRVPPGGQCAFRVQAEIAEGFGGVAVQIGLYDEQGRRLCLLDSRATQEDDTVGPGALVAICDVPALPLVPGRYSLNVALLRGQTLVDAIERAASLTVESDTRLASDPPAEHGPLLLTPHWKLISTETRASAG